MIGFYIRKLPQLIGIKLSIASNTCSAVGSPVQKCGSSGIFTQSLEQRHLFRHKGARSHRPASQRLRHYLQLGRGRWNK